MGAHELVLHYSVASRSFTALWMLEELGLAYHRVDRDLRSKANQTPDYLRLNPTGQVPTLQVGEAVVSECPAICIYLADRYAYGSFAPRIECADRGAYLKWMVFSTAVLEPAAALKDATIDFGPAGEPAWGPAWGDCDGVVRVLVQALEGRDYLVGERFTAADVMIGSAISMRLFANMLPRDPVLVAYQERLAARPAFRRASALTWPAELFTAA